jgi:hypothetical protein
VEREKESERERDREREKEGEGVRQKERGWWSVWCGAWCCCTFAADACTFAVKRERETLKRGRCVWGGRETEGQY